MKNELQTRVGNDLAFKDVATDGEGRAGYAYLGAVCRRAGIKSRRYPNRAFTADDADLDRPAILKDLKLPRSRLTRESRWCPYDRPVDRGTDP